MEATIEIWPLKKAYRLRDKIDPKPQYQRGEVWDMKKKAMLIDSILRGVDIPKIYLRRLPHDAVYDFEVADGQQRLRAIWEFFNDDVPLGDFVHLGRNQAGKRYSDLSSQKSLEKRLDQYKLTISVIEDCTDDEIRMLFARLQMGNVLNQPELRNAIASNVGYAINMMAETNPFFVNSRIPASRFKRQDYLANALTLVHFKNEKDLKAALITEFYETNRAKYSSAMMTKANKVLTWMDNINSNCSYSIRNKWGFLDIFWLLYRNYSDKVQLDAPGFADEFESFENRRITHNSKPELLIESTDPKVRDKDLYSYITAFKYSGFSVENINTRAQVFEKHFLKYIN